MIETIPNEAKAMIIALEAKNKDLYIHSVQTALIAQGLARMFSNNGSYCNLEHESIFLAGLLHDIGKLYISDSILSKDCSLTEREAETMRFHPVWGYQYLTRIETLKHLACFVRHHHELPDGSGYPNNLKLADIHPVTRILNIADRFSAMVMERPYRKAFTAEAAIAIIQKDIDTFFPDNSWAIIRYLLSISINGEYLKCLHSFAFFMPEENRQSMKRLQ